MPASQKGVPRHPIGACFELIESGVAEIAKLRIDGFQDLLSGLGIATPRPVIAACNGVSDHGVNNDDLRLAEPPGVHRNMLIRERASIKQERAVCSGQSDDELVHDAAWRMDVLVLRTAA